MAKITKKSRDEYSKKNIKKEEEKIEIKNEEKGLEGIPQEALKKVEEIKELLERFKNKILSKFEEYIMGISLLPPAKESGNKEKINVLILIDDMESSKTPKSELKEKLVNIISSIAKEIDNRLNPETILITELWENCYDGKYDILQMIALSAPLHDTGMLQAIKIAEVHKTMVLKKFEKYIVSYVLGGSLVQGKATSTSDIDVFIVIDDTDVKRMTRAELRDKLRAIIIGMGLEAGEITGIKNKLNIQVYILTDFWDNIREANPVIFTFLRDGVPFYDRGIFMPWKQLLKMGRIKPTKEAIEMYESIGDQTLERTKMKLKDIAIEDFFWATIYPSQAALMLYGMPPPTPKETPDMLREIFVKKEKLLEEEYVKMFENILKIRKEFEHGKRKDISGTEIDKLLTDSEKYIERFKKLFADIRELKEKESVLHIYEEIITVARDLLAMEGVESVKETDIVKEFENHVVGKGKMHEKHLRILKESIKAKSDYDAKRLTKAEIHNFQRDAHELLKDMIDYIHRKRGQEIERAKITVKHGKKYGEVILLDNYAFIIHDIDNRDKEISKAEIKNDGSLGKIMESNLEEFEEAIAKRKIPRRAFIKEHVFENLKEIFGTDVEVLIR